MRRERFPSGPMTGAWRPSSGCSSSESQPCSTLATASRVLTSVGGRGAELRVSSLELFQSVRLLQRNRAEGRDDPKAQVRKVPSLLPQEGPKDGKASKSRHFPLASGGEKARTGGAVFQAPLRDRGAYIESDITAVPQVNR